MNLLSLYTVLFFASYVTSISFLTPPSQDPFYRAPPNLEHYAPGEIIRMRPPPNRFSSFYFPFEVQRAWQVLLRSSDSFGRPTHVVTTIIQPFNADPSKVLSYQTFEDSSHLDCATSYGMQHGARPGTVITQAEVPLMVPALRSGYYLVVPDFEGPQAAYGAGRQFAHAVLDSIRAALQSGSVTGIEETARVGMIGYSGGAFAGSWAVAMQAEYAPEITGNLVGAALGGFVTNITSVAEANDGTIVAGLVPMQFNGLCNEYPEFKERLLELMADDRTRTWWTRHSQRCFIPLQIASVFRNFFTGKRRVFPDGFGIFNDPIIGRVTSDNSLINLDSTHLPQVPIFIYHCFLDRIVPIKDPRGIFDKWCAWGIESCEFAEDLLSGHLVGIVPGTAAAMTWLAARFDGVVPPVLGCQYTKRLLNCLYPNVSSALLNYFGGIYDALVGAELGPDVRSDRISVGGVLGALERLVG
ncbi:Lipase 1 [Candida viswanathii]|uniref:Lipase 1 n=1 Tax=Candida viswanathii TaxID=5486 RepID=A0A367YFF4_9ASCO|nr:Lipase 1 [Candida viswanathii]